MNKLNQLIKEAQDLQKQLEKLHSDRNAIYNNWRHFGQTTIGGIDATSYLTREIIDIIIDRMNTTEKTLNEKLKELEERVI